MDSEKYESLTAELRDLPEEELPAGYHDRLLAKLAAERDRRKTFTLNKNFEYKRYAAVAAGLVFTVAALGVIGSAVSTVIDRTSGETPPVAAYGLARIEMPASGGAVPEAEAKASLYADGAAVYDAPEASDAAETRSVKIAPEANEAADTRSVAAVPEAQAAEARSVKIAPEASDDVVTGAPEANDTVDFAASEAQAAEVGEALSVSPAYGREYASPVAAEKKMRTANIYLNCGDLAYAVGVINGLAGYSTGSNVRYLEAGGTMYGYADITRRVDEIHFDFVMDIIRGLGTVESETSSETSYSSEYRELEIRVRNIRAEMERLDGLMSKASSLDNMIFIDGRVSDLTWRLDSARGRMNEIDGLTSSYYINIGVNSDAPPDGPVEPIPFLERLREAFINSASATVSFTENAALFIIRLAVPALVLAAACVMIVALYRIVKKRGK